MLRSTCKVYLVASALAVLIGISSAVAFNLTRDSSGTYCDFQVPQQETNFDTQGKRCRIKTGLIATTLIPAFLILTAMVQWPAYLYFIVANARRAMVKDQPPPPKAERPPDKDTRHILLVDKAVTWIAIIYVFATGMSAIGLSAFIAILFGNVYVGGGVPGTPNINTIIDEFIFQQAVYIFGRGRIPPLWVYAIYIQIPAYLYFVFRYFFWLKFIQRFR